MEQQRAVRPRHSRLAALMGTVRRVLLWLVLVGMIGWGVLAIWYSNLPAWLCLFAAGLFGLGAIALLMLVRPRRRGRLAFLILFGLVVGWYLAIPPSNDRDWQADVAVLPYADIEGNRVTLHNIRNCDYRTETDFDVRHYDRTYDLDRLRTVDLFVVYWGSPWIAHIMLSFGFEGDDYVCISIETRKQKGQQYSTIKGFFRQYELTYVIADERDLVRLRTNYRGEDVYLYHLQCSPDLIRDVFLDYLRTVNDLRQHPEWYNALTSNCTSNIRSHTRPYAARSPWSWKLVLTGFVDQMAYENGSLDRRLPFEKLKALSRVNEQGRAADTDLAFSRRIREGLPPVEAP
jgi:hypothetical protein